jgi:hypothetical protein
VTIWHSFDYNRDYDIPAEEVARVEREKISYLDINYAPEPALLPGAARRHGRSGRSLRTMATIAPRRAAELRPRHLPPGREGRTTTATATPARSCSASGST